MKESRDFARQLERELKLKLTADEWRQLFVLGDGNLQKQTNYYFANEKNFCRIREADNKWILTCKLKSPVKTASKKDGDFDAEKANASKTAGGEKVESVLDYVAASEEFNQFLTKGAAIKYLTEKKVSAEIINELAGQGISEDYFWIGNLTTYRSKISICGNLVELDANVYKGNVDFELECEFEKGELLLELEQFLSEKKIPLRESGGKFFRFKAATRKFKEYEAVIFDFDGTLADSYLPFSAKMKKVCGKFGVDITGVNFKKFLGAPLETTMELLTGKERASEALDFYRKISLDANDGVTRLYDGITLFLDALRKKGIRLAIATQKTQDSIDCTLKALGIYGCFDAVRGMRDECMGKAEIICGALEDLQVQAKSAVMVGDTVFDIQGAKKCGMDSVAVLYGYGEPFELFGCNPPAAVNEVDELYELLL